MLKGLSDGLKDMPKQNDDEAFKMLFDELDKLKLDDNDSSVSILRHNNIFIRPINHRHLVIMGHFGKLIP